MSKIISFQIESLVQGRSGHFTHESRAVTMKLCEPKRKCSKVVPKHLQNHVVWSRTSNIV